MSDFLIYDHFEHVPPEDWPWVNFSPREMACSHSGRVYLSRRSMDRLQAVRTEFEKPMIITSAYRSPTHPIETRKKSLSGAHTTGQAFDVLVYGHDAYDLMRLAFKHGFTGVGIKQKEDIDSRFIHLDDVSHMSHRPRPWVWTY